MPIKVRNKKEVSEADLERYKLEAQLRRAKVDLGESQRMVRYWQDESERLGQELDVRLSLGDDDQSRMLKIAPSQGKGTSETTAFLVLSDWHCEEIIVRATVNGLNSYNLREADKRITRVFKKALKLIDLMRGHTSIDNLVLGLLGDFFSGYIHEELVESNGLSPIESVIWVQERIRAGIKFLLAHGKFKQIYIPCCIGNHGRTTQKPRVSTAHKNSYEWLMYHNLGESFAEESRVVFEAPMSYHVYFKVYGRTIRVHHGDYIKYHGGVGGISIPVNKSVSAWDKSTPAWLDVFGHWHQFHDWGRWISNGSLIGYSPFAVKIKADYEPPTQTLLFIEKDHGVTSVQKLYV